MLALMQENAPLCAGCAAALILLWPQLAQGASKLPAVWERLRGLLAAWLAPAAGEKKAGGNLGLAAAAGLVVWLLLGQGSFGPRPPLPPDEPPLVVPADAPDMLAVFSRGTDTERARADAERAGRLMLGLAGVIEYDARLAPAPRLVSGGQVEDLRVLARDYLERGGSFAAAYPDFVDVVSRYFQAKVGDHGGTLEPAQRAAWLAAYQGLGAACLDAARRL